MVDRYVTLPYEELVVMLNLAYSNGRMNEMMGEDHNHNDSSNVMIQNSIEYGRVVVEER